MLFQTCMTFFFCVIILTSFSIIQQKQHSQNGNVRFFFENKQQHGLYTDLAIWWMSYWVDSSLNTEWNATSSMQRNSKQVYFWIWVVIFFSHWHCLIVWGNIVASAPTPKHSSLFPGRAGLCCYPLGRHTAAQHTGRLHRVHKRAEPFPNLWSLSPLKVDLIFAWEVLESFPKIKRKRERKN